MRCARKHSTRAAGLLLSLAVAALPAAFAAAGPAQAASTAARTPTAGGASAVQAGAGVPHAPHQLAALCQQQPRPSNTIAETPWAQNRLQFDRVHTFATGREVTVAVVDTGVWAGHPQLNGPELDGGVVQDGQSFVGDGIAATVDCDGHGTIIAGIIAARPAADTKVQGIAPFAKILPVRVTNSLDEGSAGTLAEGINYAVDQGVDIINISVLTDNDFPAVVDAVKRALDNNIVVVTAAGNTGSQGNAKTWPAELARQPGFEGLIVVGATTEQGALADFTTTSVPASVAAPGTQLTGLAPIQGHIRDENTSGTSFAAPFVSGTAALVLEAFGKQLTPLQVKRRLQLTADHPGADLPAEGLGYGTVNPYEAVTAILPESSAAPATPEAGIKPLAAQTGPDTTARDVALIVSGTSVGLALITLGAVATYRRGRDRNWQPSQERPRVEV